MTKVYEILFDVNDYQALCLDPDKPSKRTYPTVVETPEGNETIEREPFDFQGRPVPDNWQPCPLMAHNLKLAIPDIWSTPESSLAAGMDAFEKVQTHFEMSGQVLDITHEQFGLKVLNVLSVIDCIDHDACAWDDFDFEDEEPLLATGADRHIAFRPDRLDGISIFRIPQEPLLLLCVERSEDPDKEFKAAVEYYGLTGVSFDLIWEE